MALASAVNSAYIDNVVQVVTTSTGAVGTMTGTVSTTTIPTITGGTQVMSLSITPQYAGSQIMLWANVNGCVNAQARHGISLCRAGTTNCLYAQRWSQNSGFAQSVGLQYIDSPNSTSAQTYSIRWFTDGVNGTLNGNGGTRRWGGFSNTSLVALELAPNSVTRANACNAQTFGKLLQVKRTEQILSTSNTSGWPVSDAAPTTAAGTQLLSINFTPLSASSTIIVKGLLQGSNASVAVNMACLFSNTTCMGIGAVSSSAGYAFQIPLLAYESSGSTTTRPYSLWYGPSAGTLVVNGVGGSTSATFGNKMWSSLWVFEVGP